MKKHHAIENVIFQPKLPSKKEDFVMDDTPEGLAKDKALLNAFMKEDIETVKKLLKSENGVRGANPNTQDEFGRTLCHLSHRWGWKEMKGILYQHGGRLVLPSKKVKKSLYFNHQRSR